MRGRKEGEDMEDLQAWLNATTGNICSMGNSVARTIKIGEAK